MQMQLGRGDDADGIVRTEPQPVTRLTMVTMVESEDWAVELPQPLLLHPGDHIWVSDAAIYVRRPSGEVTRHDGDGHWLCR
ncbi:hypothetical protein [Actinoplanes sp. HUAS TT8]|uniref:hypothetical protein n=1 Tax=Actinoplanes sp. HUAS TT8 TaxID=3447453 RepID=UPI003F51DCA5